MPAQTSSTGHVITTGLMLFALFFGAGNLIFPPGLGASSGTQLPVVLAGFLLTGVVLPLVTIIAVSTSGEGISGIAHRVGPRFGALMPLAVHLVIGPLYAVPRVVTVSYELATRPMLALAGTEPGRWALSVHAAVFGCLTMLLALKPSRLADRIGHWLTPVLLVLVAVLCVVVIVRVPVVRQAPVGGYASNPFSTGLVQGYLTMDVLAASVFGIVVLNALHVQGFADRRRTVRAASVAGVIAAALLGLVYVGLARLGARVGGDPDDGAGLLREAAGLSLGSAGVVIFAAVVVLACLTTSAGLLSAWSSYASTTWPRVGFGEQLVASTVICFCLANLGLGMIVRIVSPITLLLYPVGITLVAVTLVDAVAPGHLRATYRWGTACAVLLGLVSALSALGVTDPSALLTRTGLWNDETGWIIPTLVCVVVGLVFDIAGGRWSGPARSGGALERFPDEVVAPR